VPPSSVFKRRDFSVIFSIFPMSYRDFANFYRDFLAALMTTSFYAISSQQELPTFSVFREV